MAFGTTTIWRIKQRPPQRRLKIKEIDELIPVEESFQSQVITELVNKAAIEVFGEG